MQKSIQYVIVLVIVAIIIGAVLVLFTNPPLAFTASDLSHPVTGTTWQSISFRDAVTGENHTIQEFTGHPVIIQAFTVTCPICTRQQQEIISLKKSGTGGAFTYIALDIDPAEQDDAIRAHVSRNDFEGIYTASPVPLTRAMLDQFGPEIISPASAPTILVCGNGSAIKFPPGIKTSGYLREALAKGC